MKMTSAQNQRFPSFSTTISALGIVLYCAGFLRVELELNNQKNVDFFQFFINKSERAWFEAENRCDKIRVSKNFQ